MTEKDEGGYVHSMVVDAETYEHGITRRDWLAGLAMQGILAAGGEVTMTEVLKTSYDVADGMIEEGNK